MMNILFFSSDEDIVDEWKEKKDFQWSALVYDIESLNEALQSQEDIIVLVDYDSVAHELNKLITNDNVPKNVVVLESKPELLTGKMLLSHGIKAYGNSRMLKMHFDTMLETVANGNLWTYPQLTAALIQREESLSVAAEELLEHRLTTQEKNVVKAILEGLTNDALAHKFGITTRTVKAHVSSIFSKLHVNDRVSLILLLK